MKLQTTKKCIKEKSAKVLCAGYCSAWYLLLNKNAFAYSAGVYGWQCDYYDLGNGIILATGYDCSRLGGKRVSCDLLDEYNNKAKEFDGWSAENIAKRDELLQEFLEKALAE